MKTLCYQIILNIFFVEKIVPQSLTTLPQKSNHFLSRDSYHHTWISTTEGAVIYDGAGIKVLKPGSQNMIGANVQSRFYEDCNENMWFSTHNALHLFDRSHATVTPFQFQNEAGTTINIDYKVLAYDNQFVFTRFGNYMGIVDINNNALVYRQNLDLVKYSSFDLTITNEKFQIACLSKEELKIFTCKDFHRSNATELVSIKLKVNVDDAFGLQWLSDKLLLINTGNEILQYQLNTNLLSPFIDLPLKPVDFHYRHVEKDIIVMSKKEIICYDNLSQVKWCRAIDHKGHLSPLHVFGNEVWYGEDGVGLFFFHEHKQKFEKYKLSQSAQGVNARGLFQDKKKRLWYASRTNGIGQFDQSGDLLFAYTIENGRSPTNFVLNFTELRDGTMLASGGSHILKFDEVGNRFLAINFKALKPNHFFGEICLTQSGQILITDWNNAASVFQLVKNNNWFELKELKINDKQEHEIYQIIADDSDTLYLAANATKLCIALQDKAGINIRQCFTTNALFNDLAVVGKHKYLAFSDGLYILENNQLKKINDAPLNQNIYCILNNDNELYLSTNQGIFSYNLSDEKLHKFSLTDGLQDLEFNGQGALKDVDGNFWFSGINGINKFQPEHLKLLKHVVPINISSFKINGKESINHHNLNAITQLKMNYEENTIEFNFNGIDYSDPAAVKLKYKLANYESTWNEMKDNAGFARYPNLPPGHYTLQILAANSDGIWNEVPKEIGITITPPFWMTWWFYLLSLLSVIALVYAMVRNYYKRKEAKQQQLLREQALIIEKQQAIEAERNRIASEMHDDLGYGLTSIRFLSDKVIEKYGSERGEEELKKIANHSNNLIQNMSEIIWAMNSRFDNINSFVAYLRRFASEYLDEHLIDFELVYEESVNETDLSGEKRRNLLLVFKELLHNAVKYSTAKKIRLSCRYDDGDLIFEMLEVNGKGFDPIHEINSGNGLYNIKKRIGDMHGIIEFVRVEEGMKYFIKIKLY